IPDGNHAVLVCPEANLQVAAGPRTGDFQFLIAIEQELDWPAGLLADTSGGGNPIVRRELAAQPPADIVALHLDIARRDLEIVGKAFVGAADVLRRKISRELVAVP